MGLYDFAGSTLVQSVGLGLSVHPCRDQELENMIKAVILAIPDQPSLCGSWCSYTLVGMVWLQWKLCIKRRPRSNFFILTTTSLAAAASLSAAGFVLLQELRPHDVYERYLGGL